MRPRIYRRHPLNRHLVRVTIAEGIRLLARVSLKDFQTPEGYKFPYFNWIDSINCILYSDFYKSLVYFHK